MAASQPSNASELQLYRVLQRANLLQYYDTFISQGGDDVQQLCEAGEDEFLEIMALVGMASKPLHVRRLQKALQEWVANPAAFEGNARKSFPTHVMSMTGSGPPAVNTAHPVERPSGVQDYKVTPPQSSAISTSTPWSNQNANGTGGVSPSEASSRDQPSPADSQEEDFKDVLYQTDGTGGYGNLLAMGQPALMEHQITAIATAAALLAQELPTFEPKSMPKKQISKEIHTVMTMPPDDPRKMDALRKYAAIYGRFDSKRKNDRPMSLHEISVNEAAAQLCSHFPALLTRREELFPLARQVVRDSGYQYSKGHSRAAEIVVPPKTEPSADMPNAIPSPASGATSNEDQYTRTQAELQEVTGTLSELAKEQDRIRSALRVLLEANDHQQMRSLTAEMDDLNDQYTALTSRRQDLVGEVARLRRSCPQLSLLPVPVPGLPTMSPKIGNANVKYGSGSSSSSGSLHPSSNPLNTLYMAALQNSSDSLIEEGLRIATQYGMSDFAQELIGMKNNEMDKNPLTTLPESITNNVKSQKKDDKEEDSKIATTTTATASGTTFTTTSTRSITSSSLPITSSSLTASITTSSSIPAMQATPMMNTPTKADGVPTTKPTNNSVSSDGCNPSHGKSASNDFQYVSGKEKRDLIAPPDKTDSITGPKSHSSNSSSNQKADISPPPLPFASADPTTAKGSPATPPHSLPAPTLVTAASSTTASPCLSEEPLTPKPMETEMRRSSRRRTNDPDYYLINGGEKRFRSSNSRRSSSTSSERASKITSPSPSPTSLSSGSVGKVANLSLSPNQGHDEGGFGAAHANFADGSVGKKGDKKSVIDKSVEDTASDQWGDNSSDCLVEMEDSMEVNTDGEKRVGRRKRSHPAVSYAAFK